MENIVRKILLAAVIVGLTFVGFKFLMSFKKEPQVNTLVENVKLVKVQQVVLDSISLSVPVYGNLQSTDEIDLFPEVGGRLLSDGFREGQRFEKGATIAYIENGEMANNLKSQKSNLLTQMAKVMADVKLDYPGEWEDWESFLEQIDFEKPLPALPKASAKLKKFLAGRSVYTTYYAIQSQQNRLSKYVITAPFDGVLTSTTVKPGTAVRVGQKIGRFINPVDFELPVNVSIQNAKKVKIGDEVTLRSNDLAGGWSGQIVRINRAIGTNSQNITAYIQVSSDALYNGMYLFGEVELESASNAMEISRALLTANTVFEVKDDKLHAFEVKVLQIKEEHAIVTGLIAGQTILSAPVKGAFEGMKVKF